MRPESEGPGAYRETDVADPLLARGGDRTERGTLVGDEPLVPMKGGATHALTAEGADASEDGTGRGPPIVEGHRAYTKAHGAASADDYEAWQEAETARALNAADAHRQDSGAALVEGEPAVPIQGHYAPGSSKQGSAGVGAPGDPMYTLDTLGLHSVMAPTGEECLEGDASAWDPPPDGRRYAACGDGVAAPVSHWIGLRLAAVARGDDPDAELGDVEPGEDGPQSPAVPAGWGHGGGNVDGLDESILAAAEAREGADGAGR